MEKMRLPLSALTALAAVFLLVSCTGYHPPSGAPQAASTDTLSSVPGASAAPLSPLPSVTPPDSAALLFTQYGWSATACLESLQVHLPASLVTSVEDSPMQFFWMRAMILSGDIGFDLKPFLGKPATVKVYSVTGTLPEKYSHPAMTNTRGIIFEDSDGRIIGAHIDTGRHAGISYSLKGRDVEEITGIGIEEYWQQHYFNPSDPVNAAAAARTAEEVITRYFEGMAAGNTTQELSTLCVGLKLEALYNNLDGKLPWNMPPELYNYLVGVQVLSAEKYPAVGTGNVTVYEVQIDAKLTDLAKKILDHDGVKTRYVGIGEENGILRIFWDGTGP